MSQILTKLYLGDVNDALGDFIKNKQVTTVVNITKDIPKSPFIRSENFLRIAIDDDPAEDILSFIPVFLNFMKDHSQDTKLIHCYAGVSRSVSFVIIYLMFTHLTPFDTTYDYIKSLRPFVNINQGFEAQLRNLSYKIQCKRRRGR